MRTDGRTDMTKLIVAFRIFMKAPKNVHGCLFTAVAVKTLRSVHTTCFLFRMILTVNRVYFLMQYLLAGLSSGSTVGTNRISIYMLH
jgi:hypothetical protein